MQFFINGKTRTCTEDAVCAFLDLPEKMRRDIVRESLQWAGVTSLPMAGDKPLEWLTDLFTDADGGEDFIWSVIGKMAAAAKASGHDEGFNRLFVRPGSNLRKRLD